MAGQAGVKILCIAGPTASGKSARAVEEALARGGEIVSVDSRQVYRGLDIGTEKITAAEMRGVPHHLIDVRDAGDAYSAGDFVHDATKLIEEISSRGKLPILTGGSHFYFDALLKGLPNSVDANLALREELEKLSTEELYARVLARDSRRASELDPANRRRLVRALEIIEQEGVVVERAPLGGARYQTEWIIIDPPAEELRERLDARLAGAFQRGLIDEVRRVRDQLAKAYGSPGVSDTLRGDARLNELGLEYKIIGVYLRGERDEASLLPSLSAKLWQYAKRQKAWLRKLRDENVIS